MADLFGQIDLTELGKIVRTSPASVKKVQFKDGEHIMLNISVKEMRPERKNQYKDHYVKVYTKKGEEVQGVNYFVGDLKLKEEQQPAVQSVPVAPVVTSAQTQPEAGSSTEEVLPF